uniref:JmjC domain-containing protein n=1 Tax=Rhabditophanes sp. KR3021 TaxID=114890 RepID=A0AC35TLU1_9BILA
MSKSGTDTTKDGGECPEKIPDQKATDEDRNNMTPTTLTGPVTRKSNRLKTSPNNLVNTELTASRKVQRVPALKKDKSDSEIFKHGSRKRSADRLSYFSKKFKSKSGFGFDLEEVLTTKEFERPEMILKLEASAITRDYFSKNGFNIPISVIGSAHDLGMLMPDDLTPDKIEELIGSDTYIDVVDTKAGVNVRKKVGEFIQYFKNPTSEPSNIFNLLSLEFSFTPLAEIVRDLDWLIRDWPDILKLCQLRHITSPNFETKTMPVVQHYCLMSVKNSFTNWHIDFAGTSVWYHVLKGEKIFWLAPPTETNILLYEESVSNSSLNEIFFGKVAENCVRVTLKAGQTFFIPSGWLHAVYTPEDSIVFGGNFLHDFSIHDQVRIFKSELKTKTPNSYKLPMFIPLNWHVAANFVQKSTKLVFTNPRVPNRSNNLCSEFNPEEFPNTEAFSSRYPLTFPLLKFYLNDENALQKVCDGTYFKSEKQPEIKKFDKTAGGRKQLKENPDLKVFHQSIDKDYILSLSRAEWNGFYELHNFIRSDEDNKKKYRASIGHGITRPYCLLKIFELVLNFGDQLRGIERDSNGVDKNDAPLSQKYLIPRVKKEGALDNTTSKKCHLSMPALRNDSTIFLDKLELLVGMDQTADQMRCELATDITEVNSTSNEMNCKSETDIMEVESTPQKMNRKEPMHVSEKRIPDEHDSDKHIPEDEVSGKHSYREPVSKEHISEEHAILLPVQQENSASTSISLQNITSIPFENVTSITQDNDPSVPQEASSPSISLNNILPHPQEPLSSTTYITQDDGSHSTPSQECASQSVSSGNFD